MVKLRVLPFLTLALTLAACGAPPIATSTETATTTAPTSAVGQVGTPTAASKPSLEASQSPMVALSPAPSASASQAPAAAQPQSRESDACDHPYFPVRAGAHWTYRIEGATRAEFRETHTPSAPDAFVSRMEFPDVTVDNQWQCTSEGLRASQLSRVTTAQSQLRFIATSVTGVTLPEADRWSPGTSWETIYQVEGDRSASEGSLAQGRITVRNTILTEEPITVPAGSFPAMKVAQQVEMDLAVTVRELSAPLSLSFQSTSWYVRGVGLAKAVGGGELGESATELLSYSP